MKRCLYCLVFLVTVSVQAPAPAHGADAQAGALGHVSFPTSCDPKVQACVRARGGDAPFLLVFGWRESLP